MFCRQASLSSASLLLPIQVTKRELTVQYGSKSFLCGRAGVVKKLLPLLRERIFFREVLIIQEVFS